jgi:hypothetical protein
MKVVVSGATGLVGSALAPLLESSGHQVLRLTRRANSENDIEWSPSSGELDAERLAGIEAAVHLAGEGIAAGRWNAARKKRILDSRVVGTKLLANTLAALEPRPRVLVSASAIGYYGDRGDAPLDEQASAGDLFLSGVCHEWEQAAGPARDADIRVVHPRIGMVLSTRGGALAKMLTPFRLGLGGRVGSGRQWWSWVALDELAAILVHLLMTDSLSGPVNAVSPNPVTNLEFTKALGRALGRPTIFPMPAFAARLALGEMADELLLPSARVVPKRLQESGYEFQHIDLESTLGELLASR